MQMFEEPDAARKPQFGHSHTSMLFSLARTKTVD